MVIRIIATIFVKGCSMASNLVKSLSYCLLINYQVQREKENTALTRWVTVYVPPSNQKCPFLYETLSLFLVRIVEIIAIIIRAKAAQAK